MRIASFAAALAVAPLAGLAQINYPAEDCRDDKHRGCIARLLPHSLYLHVGAARREPREGGDRTCVPSRYLELWDPAARAESEASCPESKVSLAPLGRYFGCLREGECARPDIGIALEGGGSKSAPFALGVLAGLQRSGALRQASIVGSTSGGTYAAYYYFARLMDRFYDPQYALSREADWFRDCMPSIYGGVVPEGFANAQMIRWCKETTGGFDKPLLRDSDFQRQAPFQYQPKVGQDLFWALQTVKRRGDAWYNGDWGNTFITFAVLGTAQALTLPPHYLVHGLFDYHGNFSPSREAYRAGIERAYGHATGSWYRALDAESPFDDWPEQPAAAAEPDDATFTGSRYKRSWTLEDLSLAYRSAGALCKGDPDCHFPLWIMSSSSSAGRSGNFWIAAQPRDTLRFNFELGPHGHGSGLLGFLDVPAPRFALRDAVGVSAAFLDDQQRAVQSSRILQFAAGAGIFLGNLSWGTNVANFNVGEAKRNLYYVVPWPLYWLYNFQGLRAPWVRLVDGGNVDNLGIVPLLRRGVRTIVVAASTDDRRGEFPSLCKLKNEMELEIPEGARQSVYTIQVPGLRGFDRVCSRQLDRQETAVWGEKAVKALFCDRLGRPGDCEAEWARRDDVKGKPAYDQWYWQQPVLEGCVTRRRTMPDGGVVTESCDQARASGHEISRLLLIKPALWLLARNQQLAHPDRRAENRLAYCWWGNDDALLGRRVPGSGIPAGMELPCVALAFMHYNQTVDDQCRSGRHDFPQHEMIGMTLNSSYTLFGAYYDLGRHYGGQVGPCAGDGRRLCVRHPGGAPMDPCAL